MSLGIAIDFGTSGFRAQAIDLECEKVLATVTTKNHPLPGDNVIDHIAYTINKGIKNSQKVFIEATNKVISALKISPDRVIQIGICGNPVQLSIFQGSEIRDIAYPGDRKLKSLGLKPQKRGAKVIEAKEIPGLVLNADCKIFIPPSIKRVVGADALALILQSQMMKKNETSLAIDMGANAEMALFHKGRVFTGSAAAGPAIEGHRITCGMLAAPGVIADLTPEMLHHRLVILNSKMLPVTDGLIDMRGGLSLEKKEISPIGITGTGVMAAISQGLEMDLIHLPFINTFDKKLHFGNGIFLTEQDIREAGKAFGSIRAGYITLCNNAGISSKDIKVAYLAGASGTFVDAKKLQKLGILPPRLETIFQIGNTSLAIAKKITKFPEELKIMEKLALEIAEGHCMFASSAVFKKIYLLEISFWTEGMPEALFKKLLTKYGLPELYLFEEPLPFREMHSVNRDIDDFGELGLTILNI